MDRISDDSLRTDVFTTGQRCIKCSDYDAAVTIYSNALKSFPNDESLMSELSMALALRGEPLDVKQSLRLCERVLLGSPSEKVRHTTTAALCFIYLKAGEKDAAVSVAQNLPHIRESREFILSQLEQDLNEEDIDGFLRFIAVGEEGHQDVTIVEFGLNLVSIATEQTLIGRIKSLCLPFRVRVRDNSDLNPDRVRVRHLADYVLDCEYGDAEDAVNEVIKALLRIGVK